MKKDSRSDKPQKAVKEKAVKGVKEFGEQKLFAVVANARRVKLISESSRKNDDVDAELLARLVRADRKLLSPVTHRGEGAQADLMGIRVRAQLVELRTQAVNAARGLVKPFGQRLPACDADSLNRTGAGHLEAAIRGHAERLLGATRKRPRSCGRWRARGRSLR